MPGEGKSTVSANLSALLAQSDKSVLLVEADMRNPSFGQRLGSPCAPTVSLCELLANAEIAWQTGRDFRAFLVSRLTPGGSASSVSSRAAGLQAHA